MRTEIVVALLAAALAAPAGATERSAKAVADFKRANVCPSTGVKANKPCPGYVVDHIVPLCFGGADAPSNMTYQDAGVAKKKDRFEAQACALKKACKP